MNTLHYFQPRNFRHSLTVVEGCEIAKTLRPDCRCGIGVGISIGGAIIGAGVLGAGASVASGIMSSNAQKHASDQAAQSQKDANQLNYQMFQQAHGSDGKAVLPWYLNNSDGTPFEGSLGKDLISSYNQANTPQSVFQQATAPLGAAQQNANTLTNSVFNGGVTKTLTSNAAPVQAARLATARSSSMDALHKTLDQIDAQQASRGITGDTYGNRLLSFQAGQQAGNAVGAANLQNLQETADINNYGNVTLPLQNMALPYTQAQQAGQMAFLPNDLWLNSLSQRIQPFNFLKIGYTGPYQYQPLPTPGPGAFSGAANALAGLGGIASGAGGAATQLYQQQQNQQFQQGMLNKILAAQNPSASAYGSAFLPPSAFGGVAGVNTNLNDSAAAASFGAGTGAGTGAGGFGGLSLN